MSLAVFAERAPFVRTVRCRTAANTLSIGFDVRRWSQCSAGKSKKASRASRSLVKQATALSYLARYLSANTSILVDQPWPRFHIPLIGRVEDWRAGLGRSLCSLLSRPFVCECHTISTIPRFQPPPRRTQHADFLALRSPVCFASMLMGPILLERLSAAGRRTL